MACIECKYSVVGKLAEVPYLLNVSTVCSQY